MAALDVETGFRAEIVTSDNSIRAKSLLDNLDDAKDWAEQQSTADGDSVQIAHLREIHGVVSVGRIYKLKEGRWE